MTTEKTKTERAFQEMVENAKRFKLRAECVADVLKLLSALSCKAAGFEAAKIDIDASGLPDCTLELSTALDLEEIRRIAGHVQDGHVMYETVQTIEHYTGARVDALDIVETTGKPYGEEPST